MRNIVLTYGVMCSTISHMRFADDKGVNLSARELALQCLLPISQMSVLIRYLYYENLRISPRSRTPSLCLQSRVTGASDLSDTRPCLGVGSRVRRVDGK